jgi:tripartite-type tricarboxylate transporter receptor subunit TctC
MELIGSRTSGCFVASSTSSGAVRDLPPGVIRGAFIKMQISPEKQGRVDRLLCSLVAGALMLISGCGAAGAQTYPSRPVKVIVPFGAGSASDVTARLLATKLAESLGVSFVVENRTGAGGNIGTNAVAKAEPDGYTLGYTAIGPLAINKTLFTAMPYDPETDLEPISLFAILPNLLVVNPLVIPVSSVRDFIAYCEARPGQVDYSSIGNGSSQHLAAVQLELATGIKMKHVAYRGGPQMMTDLIKGDVPVTFQNIPTVLGPLATGQVRVLAITTAKRNKVLPDVPTMQEQGIKDFDSSAWFGFVAPKGTPAVMIDRLNRETVKASIDPALSKRMIEIGAEPSPTTPAEFKAFIAAEIVKWRKIIDEAKVPKIEP